LSAFAHVLNFLSLSVKIVKMSKSRQNADLLGICDAADIVHNVDVNVE